ncbi:MAG: hypothetical protein CMN58_06025 [Solibacterales bacterium]|nr:hypothetical protein [Bryobacterales bacterium]
MNLKLFGGRANEFSTDESIEFKYVKAASCYYDAFPSRFLFPIAVVILSLSLLTSCSDSRTSSGVSHQKEKAENPEQDGDHGIAYSEDVSPNSPISRLLEGRPKDSKCNTKFTFTYRSGRKGLVPYHKLPRHKALAVTTNSGRLYAAWWWPSTAKAKAKALQGCRAYYGESCSIYDVNNNRCSSKTPNSTGVLRVVAPNGGETVTIGRPYTIKWNKGKAGGRILIWLARGTSVLRPAITSSTPNDGRFVWKVPSHLPPANTYRILVQSRQTPNMIDISDRYFRLVKRTTINSGSDR